MKRSQQGSPERSPKRINSNDDPCMFCEKEVALSDAYIHCNNTAYHKECIRDWINQGKYYSNHCQRCFKEYTPEQLRELAPTAQARIPENNPARISVTFPDNHPFRIETINRLTLSLRNMIENGQPITVADLDNIVLPYDNHPDFVGLNTRDKSYIKIQDARIIVMNGFYEQRKRYLYANLRNMNCTLAARNRLANIFLHEQTPLSEPFNVPLRQCEITRNLDEIFTSHNINKLNGRYREIYSAKCGSFEIERYYFSRYNPVEMRLLNEKKIMMEAIDMGGNIALNHVANYLNSPNFVIEVLINCEGVNSIRSPPAGISIEMVDNNANSSCAIMGGKTRNRRRNKRRKTSRR